MDGRLISLEVCCPRRLRGADLSCTFPSCPRGFIAAHRSSITKTQESHSGQACSRRLNRRRWHVSDNRPCRLATRQGPRCSPRRVCHNQQPRPGRHAALVHPGLLCLDGADLCRAGRQGDGSEAPVRTRPGARQSCALLRALDHLRQPGRPRAHLGSARHLPREARLRVPVSLQHADQCGRRGRGRARQGQQSLGAPAYAAGHAQAFQV